MRRDEVWVAFAAGALARYSDEVEATEAARAAALDADALLREYRDRLGELDVDGSEP